jgi:DNA ligase-1
MRVIALLACLVLAGAAWAREEASSFLLAQVYRGQVGPQDYWISEKYDGVRAQWDGKVLRFRSGRTVAAPAWFLAALPTQALDGELWLGRGRFEELAAIVRKVQPVDEEWRQVRYMVFELPGAPGSFTERIDGIRLAVATAGFSQVRAVEQFRVADKEALLAKLHEVVQGGGEGLMLHRADAPYVTGRSDALLKLKPEDDAEATVIAHVPGQGRYKGMLGALRVEAPDGKRFRIGTGFSDADRRNPPTVGTLVTYRYRGTTRNGLPRFASYWRVRQDF